MNEPSKTWCVRALTAISPSLLVVIYGCGSPAPLPLPEPAIPAIGAPELPPPAQGAYVLPQRTDLQNFTSFTPVYDRYQARIDQLINQLPQPDDSPWKAMLFNVADNMG